VLTKLSVLIIGLSASVLLNVDAQRTLLDYERIEAAAFQEIYSFGNHIITASTDYDVDPHLIAAVLYVEKTQYVLDDWLRLRDRIESWTMELRIIRNSVIEWADLSTGYCRIKPSFAIATRAYLTKTPRYPSLSEEDIDPVNYGNDPAISIRIMAASLRVFMTMWEQAGHDISDKAGILATLYNIGYERSEPNDSPQNGGSIYPVVINGRLKRHASFGDRVDAVIAESRLVRELFEM
jgi:hypothetical protein